MNSSVKTISEAKQYMTLRSVRGQLYCMLLTYGSCLLNAVHCMGPRARAMRFEVGTTRWGRIHPEAHLSVPRAEQAVGDVEPLAIGAAGRHAINSGSDRPPLRLDRA